MLANMKVDIIYYKSNSDFEMEFNLCGCCRMRLLTDKSPDRKTMVHSLARAVSRSRIIMIVGSLFGEAGTIPTVSEAIGTGLSAIDNKTYGIKSEEEIKIISGATPLVTPNGFFGGCIIESGPQTMILISDNKTVRKEIMHTLIHPYIEELYANELLEKSSNTEESTAEVVSDNFDDNNLILETEESENQYSELDNSDLLTDSELTQEVIFLEDELELLSDTETYDDTVPITSIDDGILTETDELDSFEKIVDHSSEEIIADDISDTEEAENIEIKEPDIIADDSDNYDFTNLTELAYMNKQDSEMFVENDDSDESYSRGYSLKLPILILSIVLLLTLVVLCYCIFFTPSSNGSTPTAFIKETFYTLFG